MQIDISFLTIVTATVKLSLLAFAGYALYHVKLITSEFVDGLSKVLVKLLFPALIVSKIVSNFSPAEYPFWWALPLLAIAFSLGGMALGWLGMKFLGRFESHKEFMCACGFQNCGYLPMNLIVFAFSGVVADRLLVHVFLFCMGFDIIAWSLVPLFLSGKLRSDFKVSALFSAPVMATIFSLLWVAISGKGTMPDIVLDPVKQMGQAAFPMAMFVLGAYLHKYQAFVPGRKTPLVAVIFVKLLAFPAIVLGALAMLPLDSELKFFLFLQSMLPTAVSMVIIGSYTNSDNKFFSSAIFYTHLFSVVTMPVWLAVFGKFIR